MNDTAALRHPHRPDWAGRNYTLLTVAAVATGLGGSGALIAAAFAVPVPVGVLCVVMFVAGATVEVFGVSWMTALHQEIPEEKLSRIAAYDWLGSIALMPVAAAAAGPAESVFGRTAALWGCTALVALVTAGALCVPEVRNLRRRTGSPTHDEPGAANGSADPERSVGGLG